MKKRFTSVELFFFFISIGVLLQLELGKLLVGIRARCYYQIRHQYYHTKVEFERRKHIKF